MKTIICLFLLVALSCAEDADHYTDRFDNINLDEIMGNKRLLDSYVKCLLDQGRCTAEGKTLKTHLKEALETHCAKCTEAQKKGTRRMLGHLINNEPEHWDNLAKKYDPDNKFRKEYEDELKTVQA